MQQIQDISELRQALEIIRQRNQRIALVPTMGNLHDGHLALVHEARRRADFVVATIFVNPMQFGPNEDLATYPRTLASDQARLAEAGCDLLFTPDAADIYPRGLEAQTRVSVPEVSLGLCGSSRPGHFDGVATVVTMLFNLVQPQLACFGEKDYQQLAVIRRLVSDLHLPVEIVGVPIVRATDGLALSSRNGYLNEQERQRAPRLQAILIELRDALQAAQPSEQVLEKGLKQLVNSGFVPDYLELRAADLTPLRADTHNAVLLVAAHLGNTRLIDNLVLTLPYQSEH
ncbi:pantoate--beta-alanine ligase [Halomonas halocynthiae]|uniref:pantoate--beta-alanine ligase n=1 Tax=Halomonas halocynthiae TaxID=176290 RepID=UPI0003FF85CF|nr:pantoate--beta-alanine ligase [Halomonas halocynthiae]